MKMVDYPLKLEMISISCTKRVGALRISARDMELSLRERKQSSGRAISTSFKFCRKLIRC